MMDTHLATTARYLVEAAKSGIPEESRTKTAHRYFRRLLSIGVPLSLLLALRGVSHLRKPPRSNRLGSLLIEDHASGPIAGSLKRNNAWASPRKQSPGRLTMLASLVKSLSGMTAAYRHAAPATAFDVQRVLKLLSYYVFWHAVMRSDLPSVAALVRTNSPRRLALGAAAAELGIPVLVWIVERQSNRPPAPYPVDAQLCWSSKQSDFAASLGIVAARMPVPMKPLRTIDETSLRTGKVGMLLNARADKKRLLDFLEGLDRNHAIRNIQVRPHPGSGMVQSDLPSVAVLRDWRQPLPDYLDSIYTALSMTSSSMTDALMHGVPVIYRRGLDDIDDELTGLLAKGIIPELRGDDDPILRLKEHYQGQGFDIASFSEEYTADPGEESQLLMRYLPRRQMADR